MDGPSYSRSLERGFKIALCIAVGIGIAVGVGITAFVVCLF